jgi:predicted MFS family arabinose efflux permease
VSGTNHPETGVSRMLVLLLATASGAVVANLYYNQPLLATIAHDLKIPESEAGLIPMMAQAGYGLGLLFIAPLGDILERRRLIVVMVLLAALSLVLTAVTNSPPVLIGLCLPVGLFSVVPQIIVPLAATLAGPDERSRVVGTVMSGLLIGILLARTASGILGEHLGWRAVYWAASILMLVFAALLRVGLPYSHPGSSMSYRELLASLPGILKGITALQEAAITGALIFAAFSAFWTVLVFRLEEPPFFMGAQAAGIFGLVGASGASAAALSGSFADRLGAFRLVVAGLFLVLAAWALLWIGGGSLWLLGAGAVLLDFGVQGAHVANQARIFARFPEARSRINTVYMVSFFLGGALGSLLGGIAWARAGWSGVCLLGISLMVLGLFAESAYAWLVKRKCLELEC